MRLTELRVPKMDCPSEERLIRMALDGDASIRDIQVDLDARTVTITHRGEAEAIVAVLDPLGLGTTIETTRLVADGEAVPAAVDPVAERRTLKLLLAINAVMFVGELGFGLVAESTGLVADSLDMLADALVYGLALAAVAQGARSKRRAATVSGWVQAVLALGALAEVGRRAFGGSAPVEGLMIGVAAVALVANLTCVALLARHRDGEVHMRASWIFSTNDALANLGVIAAGVLVRVTGSAVPDLVIGAVIGAVVLRGAVRILRMASRASADA